MTRNQDLIRRVIARNLQRWHQFIERTTDAVPEPRNLCLAHEKCAVIIEPRQHPHLSYVIRNVMHFLDDSWGLCIVHGTKNQQFVEEMITDWGDILLLNCGVPDLPGDAYAAFKCQVSLWQQLPSEIILTFETDSILRRSGIEEFLEYDYVGAPWRWSWPAIKKTEGIVGNGGLSLRRKSVMLQILASHRYKPGIPEDVFFSRWLYRDGYHLPPVEKAARFSTETIFEPHSLGLHKAWRYHTEGPFLQLLESIRY